MATGDRDRSRGADGGPPPFFTEEAEEVARPVVPLGQAGDDVTVVRPRRGGLPRSVALALAFAAAGAAGAAGGYLLHTRRAAEPAPEARAGAAPEQTPPPPAASDGPENSAPVTTARRGQDKPQAPAQTVPAGLEEKNERRGRDEGDRGEGAKEEEEGRRRESEKKVAERRREDEKKLAERAREEEKKLAERRDEDKGEKPKARLVGTITAGRRPY